MPGPTLARKHRHTQTVLRAQDEAFLLSLGLPVAPALRAIISAVRTWGHLPVPVARRLLEDAAAMGLGPLEYLQMALHLRYRELAAADRQGRKPVIRRRRKAAR